MHDAVRVFVGRWWQTLFDERAARGERGRVRVLDVGGRSVNGSAREVFGGAAAEYVVVDLVDGPDVDVVADASTMALGSLFDVVVCCEVLEHSPVWADIAANAARHLAPGGRLIVTCAGPNRPPHSAIDEAPIRPDEWYGNVSAADLAAVLSDAGLVVSEAVTVRADQDTQVCARRRPVGTAGQG